ncbi:ATP-binding cassette domain-containing protein [Maribacter sp. 2307UL18-2]|uniref:ATP-binding cassette domain-containing protein n=1 Tax=Maribacter sp. 2307UL18-2 TaxID=3386274 RepID=UPI0039BC3AA0
MKFEHWAVFINNESHKSAFIRAVLNGQPPKALNAFKDRNGSLFSKIAIERFIDEEDRHGNKIITKDHEQSLRSMSSGEQKKALLHYLLAKQPEFMILDNPFDNLDIDSQEKLTLTLAAESIRTVFVLLISRRVDLLPFIMNYAILDKLELKVQNDLNSIGPQLMAEPFSGKIPEPPQKWKYTTNELITLQNINVRFGNKPILQDICWTIKKGAFWQLIGKNGSGKTTLLSMITGENPKGYGQELYLFGRKKGSGESIWDIKRKIGYFTPAMTDKFTGYHSVENMIISGLNDSIGLYIKPSEAQQRLAKEWLELIGMWPSRDRHFHDLSMGQKRLVMTVRAMIKHPMLLILDEPTAGLDDTSAALLVALVNKMARESAIATIFVSHRKEPGLDPDQVFELQLHEKGSKGLIK